MEVGQIVNITLPEDHPWFPSKWYQGTAPKTATVQKIYKNGRAQVAVHGLPNARKIGKNDGLHSLIFAVEYMTVVGS